MYGHSQSIESLDKQGQGSLYQAFEPGSYALRMDIGQWVRAARKFKGWSGEQLAEKLSTSKQVISHWETNRHEPTFSQILAIRDATGFELKEIGPSVDWPLVRVRREQLTCLTPDQLEQLENGIIVGLAMIQSEPQSKQVARK